MIFYLCVIIFSVLIHEFGHLITALYFKVNVKAFSLGFGPVILHKKWKNIDWRLSLLPFGGYCDIEESIKIKNSLSNIAYWKQVIILMAGVFLNFMLAVICYLIQYKSISRGIIIDLMILKPMIIKDYYYVALLLETVKANIYLTQISFLNLFLCITNLLPIPALDGGYLWMLPMRRMIGEKLFKIIVYTSFAILMIGQFIIIYYWWIL